jgi:hypothetical protein
MGFDFLSTFIVYVTVFWVLTPCDLLATYVSEEVST